LGAPALVAILLKLVSGIFARFISPANPVAIEVGDFVAAFRRASLRHRQFRPRHVEAPWIVIFPGLAISVAVFAFNFLGDSLRDWLDPRFRA
jgi:hypothetical protein